LTFIIGVVLAIAGTALSVVLEVSQQRRDRAKAPTLEVRIKTLVRALQVASASVSEIETEIFKRREMVEKLKEDVKYYEQLKVLNEAQVEAIASTLRAEMGRSQRRSLYISAAVTFVVALVFFMLGLRLGG
jgi:hypothetical protein